ncbi:hypothetical protein WN943_019754 [Citrus x changshan-huyou]
MIFATAIPTIVTPPAALSPSCRYQHLTTLKFHANPKRFMARLSLFNYVIQRKNESTTGFETPVPLSKGIGWLPG